MTRTKFLELVKIAYLDIIKNCSNDLKEMLLQVRKTVKTYKITDNFIETINYVNITYINLHCLNHHLLRG